MKKTGKTLGLALLLIVLAGDVELAYPSVGRKHPFKVTLEPATQPKKNAPITMSLTFAPIPKYPCGDSGSVSVTTLRLLYRDTLSDTTWSVQFEDGQPYSSTFQITVPDNDTTMLRVTLGCGWLLDPITRFFITTGDTVQYFKGSPRGHRKNTSSSKTNDPIRDTLTEEQLQAEYEVLLDLRDSTHRKIAEKILGPMPESSKSDLCDACHVLWVSLENLLKLVDEGVKFEFTTPPPWSRKYRPAKDSLPKKQPSSDTIKKQSALPTSPDGMSLDSVVGMTTPGELPTGQQITFRLRLNNSTVEVGRVSPVTRHMSGFEKNPTYSA